MSMQSKWAICALLTLTLLSGCTNNEEEATSSSTPSPEELGYSEMEQIEINTTCGLFYKEFLKLGSQEATEITEEHPAWNFTSEDCRESWELEEDVNDMFAYSRDIDENMSFYTKTFKISTTDIKRWLNTELNSLDNLFNAVHVREDAENVNWYYSWTTELETARLQVHSTGVTGEYTGLVSFVRSGPTAFDGIGGEAQ